MSRAPFQILVFLRRHKGEESEYLLLKRADMGVWQGVAGGGEGDETPIVAAIRETREETGVEISDIVDLKSVAELSVIDVAGYYRWGEDIRVIPEFAFLADVPSDAKIKISCEQAEVYEAGSGVQAMQLLEWDSNQQAITKAEQISS